MYTVHVDKINTAFGCLNKPISKHRRFPHTFIVKAKFHYASWFGAGSKLVRSR